MLLYPFKFNFIECFAYMDAQTFAFILNKMWCIFFYPHCKMLYFYYFYMNFRYDEISLIQPEFVVILPYSFTPNCNFKLTELDQRF